LWINQTHPSLAARRCNLKEAARMPRPTLSEAILRYGSDAYLITVGKTGPHTSHVSVDLRGNVIGCILGDSAARNIASDPNVSLLWPPNEPGGYAMIVNGSAGTIRQTHGMTTAEISVTKSVFHRRGPKPADSDGPCASDCKRIAI
jgi:hypothetical protein